MTKPLLLSLVVAAAAAAAILLLCRRPEPMRAPMPTAPAPELLTRADDAPSSPAAAADPATEPAGFAGFATWSPTRQTQAIHALAGQGAPDPDVVAFLVRVMEDRSRHAMVRNEAANILFELDRPEPAWGQALLAAVTAADEAPAWRDYAVQHLRRALPVLADPERAIALFERLAREGAGTLRGTALTQLHVLSLQRPELVPRVDAAVAALAADASADVGGRMTAVALIGERGLTAQRELVRGLVRSPPEPALRRVALAALGAIGEAGDLALIRSHCDDANPAVALAARAAADRLAQQPQKPL